jgi:geranylgeranyl diphosphate synthase, type I
MPQDQEVSVADAAEALARYRAPVLTEMREVLRGMAAPLYQMQRYHLGWQDSDGSPVEVGGGKMFRPALLLLCCEALGGELDRALPAAAAVELLHNFSLIHDDIEDDSRIRHGRRTVWDLWGAANGINAGDSMFTLARLALHRLSAHDYPAQTVLNAFVLFDRTSQKLCEGQDADLAFETRAAVSLDDYLAMIAGKTGALIAACAGMGALLAEAPSSAVQLFSRFGAQIGRAFQIQDDVLGVWGIEAKTGKSAADDIRSRKKAYPFVRALEKASPEDRAVLLQVYAEPDPEGASVPEVLALFDRLWIREDAETAARLAANEAIALLERANLRDPFHSELVALTRFVASRDA